MRSGALGDVLLLRPAVHRLRADGWRVELLAPAAPAAALVGPGPSECHAAHPLDAPVLAALHGSAPLPAAVRGALGRFDLAVVLSHADALRWRVAELAAHHAARAPLPPPGVHAAAWALHAVEDAAGSAGHRDAPAPPPPGCIATAVEAARAEAIARELPEGFVAIHPGSGSPAKNWPGERFAALARRLARPFAVVVGPADAGAAAPLLADSRARALRDLPVRVLGAVLARAGAYLGNDSGVTHLAAAWGAPCVALFGPSDPAAWAPVGSRVRVLRAAGGHLEALGVDEVAAALSSAAAGSPGPPSGSPAGTR